MTVYVGIDPGLTGGVAFLCPAHGAHVWPMPGTAQELHFMLGSGCAYHCPEVTPVVASPHRAEVWCEKGGMMPGNGSKAIFSAGRYQGMVEAICASLCYSLHFVAPVTWRTKLVGKGKNKEASRALAIQHFPELAGELKFKNRHGLAEALLIAEWGRDYGREKA